MTKKLTLTIFFLLTLICSNVYASENQSFERWQDDKFSMFIHFGLYSHLGGVWNGEPVRQGYSEQIQSFAGIFSDWYASVADDFNPVNFNADAVVALAKEAGMRSVVFTSKHHDGFCMFDSATTDYDSVDATPAGRDYVRELSDACARAGIRFGLYFSLIDWHCPYAFPISSHNADFITEQHHELNKAQVRELLTSYGPVSELWFDMGALTPTQSQELYSLVKEIQPECMVSGRLGNDVYDFAVMADNRLPDRQLHASWQSAASMFPETWSWRSWQERGDVGTKVSEKLKSLTDVASRGGNYLLNIGPQSDGSVVPFEREVLIQMGLWLKENGDAVYGTSPSPYRNLFDWGCVTVKGNRMNLILTGVYPEDGRIVLPVKGYHVKSCCTEGVECIERKGILELRTGKDMFADMAAPAVIRLDFDKDIEPFEVFAPLDASAVLAWDNAAPDYSYSCFDYYSNYRSTVGYNWVVSGRKKVSSFEIIYTQDEIGRKLLLEVGNERIPVELDGMEAAVDILEADVRDIRISTIRGGVFDRPSSWADFDWQSFTGEAPETVSFASRPFTNYLLTAEVVMQSEGYTLLDVYSGNGVELIVNGEPMMKHLNPYRSLLHKESVLLYLQKGKNQVAVRSYNRFEKVASAMVGSGEGKLFRNVVTLPASVPASSGLKVRISALDRTSSHSDCLLHNIRLKAD